VFIFLLLSSSLILLIFTFFFIKNYYQLKMLKKYFSKVEFELVHERQKHQTVIAELAEIKKKFNQQVLFDPLTGLASRQVFEDRLAQVLNQSKRFQLTFAVLFLNIDQFDRINEVFGYEKADELLKEVANRLKACIRRVDTVSRFTGDNFVFVVTQLAKPETVVYIVRRLLDALSQPFYMNEHDFFISGNIGIAVYPSDGDDINTLLRNADSALKQAKAEGRHTYQFYHAQMHEFSQRELILNSNLLSPTVFKDFLLYYRPHNQSDRHNITSIDVVLQWQHPEFGLIESVEFFRLAENSGKIMEIGEWMLRTALLQFQQWQSHNVSLQKIAIPVSWRQLESSHFVYKVSQLLQELNLNPHCLVLEISEEALSLKLDLLEKALYMLKHLGVKIGIANFGIGHLSWQRIQKLPIEYIKIDRTLIEDRGVNP